jgi:iron complex outermembrane recepter protein
MSRDLRRLAACVTGALMQASVSAVAYAAETAPAVNAGLEEVVVTATRREERLQDVPISVTAFSQEKIDSQGLKNIDDLTRLSPGVTFSRNGMGSSANYNDEGSDINIRGIDSTAGTSTTGVYIDDTPIQTRHLGFGSVNPFPQLFDVDRVEVLRGPQGTLFGAGAEGGVVRFISPDPDLHKSSGYLRGDFSKTNHAATSYEAGAAFGAPIIDDKLAFRVSASYRQDGGWVDRVGYNLTPNALAPTPTPVYNGSTTEANANWQQIFTFRAALNWKPNDSLEVIPSFYYQKLQINDTAAYWLALSDPSNGVYRNGNQQRNPSTDPFSLSAVKVKWDAGFADFYSNTAYFARNQSSVSDYTQYLRATWSSIACSFTYDAQGNGIPCEPGGNAYQLPNTFAQSPQAAGSAPFADSQRNFYQELRLSSKDATARLTWTGGLFYSHLKENVYETIVDPTLDAEVIKWSNGFASVCYDAQPCPNGLIFNGPLNEVVDKQLAVFGEATFKITDTFKVTGGLRYSKLDYTGSVNETGPFLGTTIVTSSSATEKPVTPKLLLSYQPDRDNLFYASASKGFRPGGPNVGVGSICSPSLSALGIAQVPNQFASDSLWSYELGSKNTFLDRKLQVNASLFYVDWKNIQQNVYLPACGEQFTANLGQARSQGGDIEIIYRPIAALTLDFTAAYTDAKLTKTSCAGSLVFDGKFCTAGITSVGPIASKDDALLGAPLSFTFSGEWKFGEWMGGQPYARVDYQHTTAQTKLLPIQNSANGIYDTTLPGLPSTTNLSLRAGLRTGSGVDLSIYGNNLTNAHPQLFTARDIYNDKTDLLYFGRGVRPLTIGITATYRY